MKIFLLKGNSIAGSRLYVLNSAVEEKRFVTAEDLEIPAEIGAWEAEPGDSLLLSLIPEVRVSKGFRAIKVPVSPDEEELVIGFPAGRGVTVTGGYGLALSDDPVASLYPLPFRSSSFGKVYLVEALDYDLVREACRVLKPRGTLIGVYRDPLYGGIDPRIAVRVISYKFNIQRIEFKDGFWLIEGKMRKLCGTEK